MANTYTLISSLTVGSGGTSSVTFSSIPSTYTDLKIVYSARLSNNNGATWYDLWVRFNSSTTTYSGRFVYGNGSTVASSTDGTEAIYLRPPANTSTASTFGNGEFYVPNYTGSTNKSVSVDNVSENNATSAIAVMTAGLWGTTSAITSITLLPSTAVSANIVEFSTFYLYGIKNS